MQHKILKTDCFDLGGGGGGDISNYIVLKAEKKEEYQL